jgi:hypothetical protein
MNGDISMERPTISAHRLWTTLWKFLGQPLDNCMRLVGNRQATSSFRGGTHTTATAPGLQLTAHVGTGTPSGLREAMFSPASTVPMTTTELYLTQIPSAKKAPRGAQRALRWHA